MKDVDNTREFKKLASKMLTVHQVKDHCTMLVWPMPGLPVACRCSDLVAFDGHDVEEKAFLQSIAGSAAMEWSKGT